MLFKELIANKRSAGAICYEFYELERKMDGWPIGARLEELSWRCWACEGLSFSLEHLVELRRVFRWPVD